MPDQYQQLQTPIGRSDWCVACGDEPSPLPLAPVAQVDERREEEHHNGGAQAGEAPLEGPRGLPEESADASAARAGR